LSSQRTTTHRFRTSARRPGLGATDPTYLVDFALARPQSWQDPCGPHWHRPSFPALTRLTEVVMSSGWPCRPADGRRSEPSARLLPAVVLYPVGFAGANPVSRLALASPGTRSNHSAVPGHPPGRRPKCHLRPGSPRAKRKLRDAGPETQIHVARSSRSRATVG